jgi:hypothetical protein
MKKEKNIPRPERRQTRRSGPFVVAPNPPRPFKYSVIPICDKKSLVSTIEKIKEHT